jgi:hypothetical protein
MSKFLTFLFLTTYVTLLTSCVTPRNVPLTGQGGADKTEVDLINSKAQLMVREFLIGSQRENPYYNYYSYLIFTENSVDNYDKRFSAAKAYMCEFSDSSKAMEMGLTADELVVFYAPVYPDIIINQLKASKSPDEFLKVYNYDYARAIANKVSPLIPDVDISIAIISYPMPIGLSKDNIDYVSKDALNIIDLSDIPPAQIRKVIEKFRRSVTGHYEVRNVQVVTQVDPITGEVLESKTMKLPVMESLSDMDWMEKMRVVFASLGSFMETFVPDAKASTTQCK